MASDILGAPASNAGDEFHELWALRSALGLVPDDTDLTAVTLEGVKASKENNTDERIWDGVDCAFYYGGDAVENSARVDLFQLKYSAGSPDTKWSLARLIHNSAKSGNNSVARRLGNAFKAALVARQGSNPREITIGLVSNQPFDDEVKALLSTPDSVADRVQKINSLKAATGLNANQFEAFCSALTLKGGEDASAILRTEAINRIANWTDTSVIGLINDLRIKIQELMLPAAAKAPIYRSTVLSWFGLAESFSLFPCKPYLEVSTDPIPRLVFKTLGDAVKANSLVCLEGEGGCGKTTAVQMLQSQLPAGSECIVFDCYGAGRYLDSSESRHRPFDVFTQLSNELALRTRAPILVAHQNNPNIVASFRRRLDLSAELIAAERPGALLVVILDAADNSIFAASRATPPDKCAVSDFLSLTNLPANVRLVVSARSSRIDSLRLPHSAIKVTCGPFTEPETAALLRKKWPEASVEDSNSFHLLSNAVPRVQTTTISAAETVEAALELLRPNGKNLRSLFNAILAKSIERMGGGDVLEKFCGALSVLATPTPPALLAVLAGETEPFVKDVCNDLSPNVRLTSSGFEFANEDFEAFIREAGVAQEQAMTMAAAGLLFDQRLHSQYAAIHVADLLVAAGRHADLFHILDEVDGTRAISDKTERRRADLHRLKAAISVATKKGDVVQAAKVVLIGAEAVRSENKVFDLLANSLDLSSQYSETMVRQEILRNPDHRALHGQAFIYLARKLSEDKSTHTTAREWCRYANEWIRERNRLHQINDTGVHSWKLEKDDIVALTYAEMNIAGWTKGAEVPFLWQQPGTQILTYTGAVDLKAKRFGSQDLADLKAASKPDFHWIVSTAQVRSGIQLTSAELEAELDALLNSDSFDFPTGNSQPRREQYEKHVTDRLLFFAHVCATNQCAAAKILKLVAKAWPAERRVWKNLSAYHPQAIDFTYRAAHIEVWLKGQEFKLDEAFAFNTSEFDPVEVDTDASKAEKRQRKKDHDELKEKVSVVETFYKSAMAGDRQSHGAELLKGVKSVQSRAWRYDGRYEFLALLDLCADRVTDVFAISADAPADYIEAVKALYADKGAPGSRIVPALTQIMTRATAFDLVIAEFSRLAVEAESLVGPASERADALMVLAGATFAASPDDAKTFFDQGIKFIEDLDIEAIDQVLFVVRAVQHFPQNTAESRSTCTQAARIFERASVVLRNEDFPFRHMVDGLVSLSLPIAACAVGRWSDVGTMDGELGIDAIIQSGLARGIVDIIDAAALSVIVSSDGLENIDEILAAFPHSDADAVAQVRKELACRAKLHQDPTTIRDLWEKLSGDASQARPLPRDLQDLSDMAKFLRENEAALKMPEPSTTAIEPVLGKKSPNGVGFKSGDFDPTTADGIAAALSAERSAGNYDQRMTFAALRAISPPPKRVDHLRALKVLLEQDDYPPRYFDRILEGIAEWGPLSPAVKSWAHDELPGLVIRFPGAVLGYNWYQPPPLEALLDAAQLSADERSTTLLKTIEANGDQLGSTALFMYAAHLVQSIDQASAQGLMNWYLERWEKSQTSGISATIPAENFSPDSLPSDFSGTAATLIYRLLGDADVEMRWKATHAVLSYIRMGRTALVGQLLAFRNVQESFSFSATSAPFHFLTARLWLSMLLARVGSDAPEVCRQFEDQILDLYVGGPPHLLIGLHVHRALRAAQGALSSGAAELETINAALAPKAGYTSEKAGYRNRRSKSPRTHERFHFDEMDVIPYWYNSALSTFPEIDLEDFLVTAERWIVDAWGGDEKSSHWNEEPRRKRWDRNQGNPVSHGNYPAFERHSYYLQWHAMFVAAGELLATYAVAAPTDDNPHSGLDRFLHRWDTTQPPVFLADYRSPKPNEVRLWAPIQYQSDAWFDDVTPDDLANELHDSVNRTIVVESQRETRFVRYGKIAGEETVRVSSAFVMPETGPALVRALQIMPGFYDAYLPIEDYPRTETGPEFLLSKTTINPLEHRDLGFDEDDPFRKGLRGQNAALVEEIEGDSSFIAWSELNDRLPDKEMRSIEGQFSDGHRLTMNQADLIKSAENQKRSVIFCVTIERTRRDRNDRYNEEDTRSSKFARYFLLDRGGKLQDFDGYLAARH